MATFPGSIGAGWTYTEADRGDPSPKAYYTTDSLRLLRDILVNPGTMKANYAAAKAFLGFPTLNTVLSPGDGSVKARYVSRSLPDIKTWTDFPNALIAVAIEGQQGVPPGVRNPGFNPWNAALAVNEHAVSTMRVEYRSTNYEVRSDADCWNNKVSLPNTTITGFFFSQGLNYPDEGLMLRYIDRPEWNYAGKVRTFAEGIVAFVPDAGDAWPVAKIPSRGGIIIREPMYEITLVHRELPFSAVPLDTILRSLNTMNGPFYSPGNPTSVVNNFDLPGWNIPPYCALFVGAKPYIGKLITGERGVNMAYKFLVAPNVVRYGSAIDTFGGWRRQLNVLPNAVAAGPPVVDYRELKPIFNNAAGTDFQIQTSDFSKLFRPPQV